MQGKSTLDSHIERQTKASRDRSTTKVRSLAKLACDGDAIRSHSSAAERLFDELVKSGRKSDSARTTVDNLFLRTDLDIHTDAAWHFSELEVPMLDALLKDEDKDDKDEKDEKDEKGGKGDKDDKDDDISLEAVVAAGLAINLHSEPNLLAAAERLIATEGMEAAAFAACCEYARITVDWQTIAKARARLADAVGGGGEAVSGVLAIRVLELRQAVLLRAAAAKAQERSRRARAVTSADKNSRSVRLP